MCQRYLVVNAYLEAYTTEKLVIHACKDFGDQENTLLIITKGIYEIWFRGLRFVQRIAWQLS